MPPNALDMLRVLVEGREAVARTARSIFPLADKASDEPTADLLTQRLTVREQAAWMLRANLEARWVYRWCNVSSCASRS